MHSRPSKKPDKAPAHPEDSLMLIVAGLTLKNLKPRVWDATSPYYLPDLQAVMLSYSDFHHHPVQRRKAMEMGLHRWLGLPEGIKVYLDNGAFSFLRRVGETPRAEYEAFVQAAQPDWYPIPQDYIPTPRMTVAEQQRAYQRTMDVNLEYRRDGYVPIIHISRRPVLDEYVRKASTRLSEKTAIALGGIVPNLLRAPKAMPYRTVLEGLKQVRREFADKQLHVFGIGGIATLHLAALLGMDSVDSSGWRNRAARGIVQLAGSGDRVVAELGKWRGRRPDDGEWEELADCDCPACKQFGLDGLKARAMAGFCHRATHNLWTLLDEARLIEKHLRAGKYRSWYRSHLNNSIYLRLIDEVISTTPSVN